MDYAAARHNMVESQIRTNRVNDSRIIAAMAALPRELFVPKQLRGIAYVDEDIDLGGGRSLMEPVVFARLVQLAQIAPTDVVLDIGCATGYSAAVLSHLASTVVALEADSDLANRATGLLAELGVDNVALVAGPLNAGYASQGPYNAIILEGSVQEVPAGLCEQLAEGGRLVAVIEGEDGIGRGTVITRIGGGFSRRAAFDANVGPLPGFARKPAFVF